MLISPKYGFWTKLESWTPMIGKQEGNKVNAEEKKTGVSSLNLQDQDYTSEIKLNGHQVQEEVSRFSLLEAEQKLLKMVQTKPCNERRIVNVGDKVLVERNNKKRLKWPHGRFTEEYPDRNGAIKRVREKTSDVEFLTSIQCIYPLEASAQEYSTNIQKE
ncbi:unnamed protein product [Orchesella dallaii]|uniref:DUF5641 domain-containing protein n=1 Tax=Orchesella dallaii TaxID=48710 RepID=A0ABP1SAP6_9HEXA